MQDLKHWLIQAWTQQLYREYDNILFQHQIRMRPIVIKIEERMSRWGEWDPNLRSIMLSKALIEQYSWDIVVEVLKHEMAHQLVTEQYGPDHTHGERFLWACRRFGVAAWATRASGDLPTEVPSWKDRALSNEEEKLLRRVEKLLALATSSNEHEALLAMQKVRELYAMHNLEQLRHQRQTEKVFLVINRKKKRLEATESMIFSILSEHFFVQVVMSDLFDAQALDSYKTAEIFGTRENVLMAEYVYYFLWNKIHSLWQAYKTSQVQNAARAKKSYMLGVLSGFSKKLRESQNQIINRDVQSENFDSSLNGKSLVALTQRDLEAFVQQRYPRLSRRHAGYGYSDASAYSAGITEGRNIVLNKGVTERQGSQGLFLKA